jgi:DNA-binding CsgD family transcriptional regulator
VATAFQEPAANVLTDFARLNEGERAVLRLLAEGHTAKSIANLLGSTPAAVNERLREARRKTGVGSSRELARLFRAQECRDEQIGVEGHRRFIAGSAHQAAELWRPQTGMLAMVGLFIVAAAGAAALMSQTTAPARHKEVDPLIAGSLERFPQPADLHAQLRSQKRDPNWAPRMEIVIRARLVEVPLVGKNGNALRVTCARTLCEIAGTVITTKDEADDQNSPSNRTIQALQVPPLPDDLSKAGLKNEGDSFFSGNGKPDRIAFLLYYSRAR